MLQRIAFVLGLAAAAVAVAGVAAAEPSSRPVPKPRPFKSLFPIEAAGGGLVGKRTH